MNAILIFMTFSLLTLIGLINDESRTAALSRSKKEWLVDFTGLFIQGVIIPAFPFFLVPLLIKTFPQQSGTVEMHPAFQFLLSFVAIDYLYYWNHRIFHGRSCWSVHRLHHSSRHLDIFATSRNSLITSFMFIYIWAQIFAMFFLKDSTAFLLGLAVTFALDLWRHSGMNSKALSSFFGWILIMPEQHVVHHSLTGRTKNYGANLCWWDKLHGTYSGEVIQNRDLEKMSNRSIWSEILFPWRKR